MAWDECGTGQHYKVFEPLVPKKVKFTSTNCRKEIAITRLRLGKCRLNAYQYQHHLRRLAVALSLLVMGISAIFTLNTTQSVTSECQSELQTYGLDQ